MISTNHYRCSRRRRGSLLRALMGSLLLAFSAEAHLPEGREITAFQFPPDHLPQIDGDLSDWTLAGAPAVNADGFFDLVADAAPDRNDFDVSLWVGWSEEANRIFVAAEVVDDQHQVDRASGTASSMIFLDDDMEVFIDADHSGGQFADFSDLSAEEQFTFNGTQASHFILAGPHPDRDFFVNFSAAAWYALDDGAYTEAALTFSGTPGGRGVTRYEFSFRPFDLINVTADFLSSEHDLQEGETIGLNVEFNDFDAQSSVFDAKWSLSGGQNAFRLSERFTDLRLAPLEARFLPTSIESASWARIKASFRRNNDLYLYNSTNR